MKERMNLPTYTQIPNLFLENMHKYHGASVKVFLTICRKTIGWHKLSDRISYSQIMKDTGLSKNIMYAVDIGISMAPSKKDKSRNMRIIKKRKGRAITSDFVIAFEPDLGRIG